MHEHAYAPTYMRIHMPKEYGFALLGSVIASGKGLRIHALGGVSLQRFKTDCGSLNAIVL